MLMSSATSVDLVSHSLAGLVPIECCVLQFLPSNLFVCSRRSFLHLNGLSLNVWNFCSLHVYGKIFKFYSSTVMYMVYVIIQIRFICITHLGWVASGSHKEGMQHLLPKQRDWGRSCLAGTQGEAYWSTYCTNAIRKVLHLPKECLSLPPLPWLWGEINKSNRSNLALRQICNIMDHTCCTRLATCSSDPPEASILNVPANHSLKPMGALCVLTLTQQTNSADLQKY